MKLIRDIAKICEIEFWDTCHDKGVLIFIFFVPLIYPLLYSAVYTGEVVLDVPTISVNECGSKESREFIRKVDATADVEIVAHCNNMLQAKKLLEERKAYGIVYIPQSFSSDLQKGEQTRVGVYCDMSSMLYYKDILLAVNNVSLDVNKDIKVSKYTRATTEKQKDINRTPIEYEYKAFYNTQSGFASFLIPPVLMLIIQQTLLLGVGMTMGRCRERNKGNIIPNHPAYSSPAAIVLGKGLMFFVIYLILALYMYVVVTYIFTLPDLTTTVRFIRFIVPYLLACISFSIVFSKIVFHREDCIMLFVFLSVPLLFISGVSWPIPSMPLFWKYVSYIFPSTFGLNGYVRITSMGCDLSELGIYYYGMWVQAFVYFTIAVFIYRRALCKRKESGKKRNDKD